MISARDIEDGLRRIGVDESPALIVHSSLRSFGGVDGGAAAVCEALTSACRTLLLPAATWDLTGVPCPPGLVRPHNSAAVSSSWDEFDAALARAVPYSTDLPIDRELGAIPEMIRTEVACARSYHPLLSYISVGPDASALVDAQRLDWPLGPLEVLAQMGGHVLLVGVSHSSNTVIHLAEQRLGRSRFYRYAKSADHVWCELPNVPGQSHRFDDIESALADSTRETLIGVSRVRLVGAEDVVTVATRAIEEDPGALLCEEIDESACRCAAAREQRLAMLKGGEPADAPLRGRRSRAGA